MSAERQRPTAKRELAVAERSPSPFRAPFSRTRRRTRRRIGSHEEPTNTFAADRRVEPESEEIAHQNNDAERTSEHEPTTSSSKASTPAGVRTPDADTLSVISIDASPHGSVFDFLSFGHTGASTWDCLPSVVTGMRLAGFSYGGG